MEDDINKNKFIELRSQGLSFAKISKALNTSKPTLIKWSRYLKEEIENLRKINWEEFREKHNLIKKRRIILLSKILDKIEKEIEKREFDDITTDKLINLASDIMIQSNLTNSRLEFTSQDLFSDSGIPPSSWGV